MSDFPAEIVEHVWRAVTASYAEIGIMQCDDGQFCLISGTGTGSVHGTHEECEEWRHKFVAIAALRAAEEMGYRREMVGSITQREFEDQEFIKSLNPFPHYFTVNR